MLEAGKFRSITEIAKAEKVDRACVSRLLDLTFLAPDIQEAILDGRQAKGVSLEELTRAVPEGMGGAAAFALPVLIAPRQSEAGRCDHLTLRLQET